MKNELKIIIGTEDGKNFRLNMEAVQKLDALNLSRVLIHHKILKEDGFPIQIEPFPDETDYQEFIRLAVKIFQKSIKEAETKNGKP